MFGTEMDTAVADALDKVMEAIYQFGHRENVTPAEAIASGFAHQAVLDGQARLRAHIQDGDQ